MKKTYNIHIAIYFLFAFVLASLASCNSRAEKASKESFVINYTTTKDSTKIKVRIVETRLKRTFLDSLVTSTVNGDTLHHTVIKSF